MAQPPPKTFLVSDESINCYGIRILTAGLDTAAFEQNPVMFYMHKRDKVFGAWANLRKDTDGKVYAEPVFDTADDDEEVQSVAGKVERDFLKAASLGVELDMSKVFWNDALGCYDAPASRLEEISIVSIPGNRNAIRLYKGGEPISELQLTAQLAEIKPADLPPSTNQSNMSQYKKLALAAGIAAALAETATEEQVSEAIVNLSADQGYKAKYEALLKEQEANQLTLASDLVTAAVTDGRIPATMKDNYLKLFKADHEGTAAILASMTRPQNLVQLAKNGGAVAASANFLALSGEEAVKEWDRQDKANSLMKLKAENRAGFDHLFEQKFGKKPQE